MREAGSRETDRILPRETFETRRTERTSVSAAMPSPAIRARPGIRLNSIEGMSPASASPRASFSAHTAGKSRDTETPGGGSLRKPQVRGRAFKKSTAEMRNKAVRR